MPVHIMYAFDKQSRFTIKNFNQTRPFSSFLPGLAGIKGKPMWALYVNRGQCIASFGVKDKDGAILEFQPAHKAYQLVPTQGFRTFIKHPEGLFEPFAYRTNTEMVQEKMVISPNGLDLSSVDDRSGLAVHVSYFILPHESFPALVRQVTIQNLSNQAKPIEVLDGLPAILPYGIENEAYKRLGHTLRSWMDVYHLESGVPYYKLRASTVDTEEVKQIDGGHFYFSFIDDGVCERIVTPIVDIELVFGQNSTFSVPDRLLIQSLQHILSEPQITTNKVPCGFTGAQQTIEGNGQIEIFTIIGHTDDITKIHQRKEELAKRSYIQRKKNEAKDLVEQLTQHMDTQTSLPLFDAYCKQSYLDNLLRGGYPIPLHPQREDSVYYVYSRKHGDLERDYNFFSLDPSYYSQGNGNYRDANQNRRSDVWFHPEIKDFNIITFMSLIQTDGYNPLVIKGTRFTLNNPLVCLQQVDPKDHSKMAAFFDHPFTPGQLLEFLENQSITLLVPSDQFMAHVIADAEQNVEAEFAEGYWIDHWTYNLDLIENYLAIYPDQLENLLFHKRVYKYFDSPAVVLPREEKVVYVNGKVRQFGAVQLNEAKKEMIEHRKELPHWVRVNHGRGDIYHTHLYEKLVFLALIKYSTIDMEGIGIEMEASKPGWNDSMNGLPGLFASGFSELCELKRLLAFLIGLEKTGPEEVSLPQEMASFLFQMEKLTDQYERSQAPDRDFWYWDQAAQTREQYRQQVMFGILGELRTVAKSEIERILRKFIKKVDRGIEKARNLGQGIYPTYFYYEAMKFEPILDQNGQQKKNAHDQPLVRVTEWRRVDLPYFLEGPTRAMKIIDSLEIKRDLYQQIKQSDLYDPKLNMYKLNASLSNESYELGRVRAFTPGWLENESIFLHMEYKYVLELLRGGLYEEFFTEIHHVLIPFLDPATYGRSTLENCSFIASSANPDPTTHGTGYVARLSGSTAEWISMWNLMMWGNSPFVMREGKLNLRLRPILPAWLFNEQNQIRATFLGYCQVIYHNPERKNTYGPNGVSVKQFVITLPNGEKTSIAGNTLDEKWARLVRNKQVQQMEIILGSMEEGLP